jgi:hypothetical protein
MCQSHVLGHSGCRSVATPRPTQPRTPAAAHYYTAPRPTPQAQPWCRAIQLGVSPLVESAVYMIWQVKDDHAAQELGDYVSHDEMLVRMCPHTRS